MLMFLVTITAALSRSIKWPGHGSENRGAWVQFPAEARDISPKLPGQLWAPSSLLFNGYQWRRGPFLVRKQARTNSIIGLQPFGLIVTESRALLNEQLQVSTDGRFNPMSLSLFQHTNVQSRFCLHTTDTLSEGLLSIPVDSPPHRPWMNGIWVRALPGPMHLGLKTGPLCPNAPSLTTHGNTNQEKRKSYKSLRIKRNQYYNSSQSTPH
jgi:hypothetical protein